MAYVQIPHHHTATHHAGMLNGLHLRDDGRTIRRASRLTKSRLLASVLTLAGLIVSFLVLSVNLLATGPTIPGKDISGSTTLIPHTSLAIPLSGLYCESITLSREAWDNSEAARAWIASVYIFLGQPPLSKEYDFSIVNDNVTLSARSPWYMRSVHLHLGSVYSINSCVLRGIPEVEACMCPER